MTLTESHHHQSDPQSPPTGEQSSPQDKGSKRQELPFPNEHLAIEGNGKPPPPGSHLLLTNNFIIRKKCHRVVLSDREISWERIKKSKSSRVDEDLEASNSSGNGGEHHILPCEDIIQISLGESMEASIRNASRHEFSNFSELSTPTSSSSSTTNNSTPPQYLTIHYAKRLLKSSSDCNRWRIHHLTLHHENPQILENWCKQLQRIRNEASTRLRRILVFINPLGGRKQGLQIYERWCKPIIELAGIDASCIITQRANQIRDILMSHDLSGYDAVCCVGGDGTVAELINGLLYRALLDEQLDLRKPQRLVKPRLPIAVIPAGSTDTIVYSLHGTSDVQTATIHLVLGQRRGLDVCSVSNRDGLIRFCTSVMGYGYLGDVASTSEKYRWMGVKRYEYTGVKAFLANRGYEAEIHLLSEKKEEEDRSQTNGELFSLSSETREQNLCGVNCIQCMESETTLSETEVDGGEGGCHVIKGNFFLITGSNISCACTRSPNGIAKYCHSGDGYIHVVLVRKTCLLNNLRFVRATMSRDGDIRTLPFIEIHRTRKFTFKTRTMDDEMKGGGSIRGSTQPIVESLVEAGSGEQLNTISSRSLNSSWNCDGEVVSDLEITMSCHRQLVQVLMRGPYSHEKPQSSNSTQGCWQKCLNCCSK